MPTYGSSSCRPWNINPRLWSKCLTEVGNEMVAAGWHPKAFKFNDVCRRKAEKRFNAARH